MAPRRPDPLDNDRIDISLDLVGEGSLAAINQLTAQLATVSAYMANVHAMDPAARAAGATVVAGQMQAGIQHGGHAYQSLPPAGPQHQDAAGQLTSRIDPRDEPLLARADLTMRSRIRDDLKDPVVQQGGLLSRFASIADRELETYGAVEREQATRPERQGQSSVGNQGYRAFYSGGGIGGGGGRPSEGASMPPPNDPNDPTWRRALRSNSRDWEDAQEGFSLPPGGLSLNWQDKLNLGANMLTRSAEKRFHRVQRERQPAAQAAAENAARQEAISMGFAPEEAAAMDPSGIQGTPDMSDVATGRGRLAGLLRMAAPRAGELSALGQEFRMRGNMAYAYGSGYQQQGVAAGYDRAGQITIPGTDIGFTNPLDFFRSGSAGREALNQRLNTQRLRMKGGIDGQQAQQIVSSLAGNGWTGEQGQNAAFQGVAPLVQQGMNPELATNSFDRMVRQGNTSLEDFRKTMDKLGDSAKAANMSLDEYQQGLDQFAEAAQGVGASGSQGYRLGRNMTNTLGIAPQVASQMFQSPLIQGMAMSQGVLPNEMGLMGANQMNSSIFGGMTMAMRATQQFRNQPITDPVTGKKISGSERQLAQAATIMGMSPDEFKRLWGQRGVSQAAGKATDLLDRYSQNTDAVDHETKGQSAAHIQSNQQIKKGDWVPTRDRNAPGATRMPDGSWAVKATVAGYGEKYSGTVFNQAIRGQAEKQLGSGQWNQIDKTLRQMAPTSGKERADYLKRVEALGGEDGKKRVADARKLITEQTKIKLPEDNLPTVNVAFKGAAGKYFEQIDKKRPKAANSGGTSSADDALLPQAPAGNPLSDYMRSLGP